MQPLGRPLGLRRRQGLQLGVDGQQLACAVRVVAVAAGFEAGWFALVVGAQLHAKQGVERAADGGAKTVAGLQCGAFGAGGQSLEHALRAVAKDRKRPGQDVLVEVTHADEGAVAAVRQLAQHQQCRFVQVLQLVEQHGIKAALQLGKGLAKVQGCQLPGQRIGAVARCVEHRFLIQPGAQALVFLQQPQQAVVQRAFRAKSQGAHARLRQGGQQQVLLGQCFKSQKGVDVEGAQQVLGQIGIGVACLVLLQCRIRLLDQQMALQSGVQQGDGVALFLQQLGAQLLHGHHAQGVGHGGGEPGQAGRYGFEAGFRIGQHQNALRAVVADQIGRLDGQGGGFAGAGQRIDQQRRRLAVEGRVLLQGRVALQEGRVVRMGHTVQSKKGGGVGPRRLQAGVAAGGTAGVLRKKELLVRLQSALAAYLTASFYSAGTPA